jgi:glycosyltransferase involved in cell wall biosynthesis
MKPKLIRVTTVPESLKILLRGQHNFMTQNGFDVIGISTPGNALLEVSKEEKIRVIEISMSREITLFKDLQSLYKLYKAIKKEKPIIVHSHTPKAGILSMAAAKLANVPIRLHTVAGLPLMEAKGVKRKILNYVEKLTYKFATNVYPNSKGLYDFIIKEKLGSSVKLNIIANGSSNGIDFSHFDSDKISDNERAELKAKLKIQNNDFVFVFVGRLVGDKGINELVSAFAKMHSSNVKLLLVGGFELDLDPLRKETLLEIDQNQNIISVGFQKDVRPYFSISHCLVFPSYREGFPNVVMQAGAMGLPSIVTDINGCNEIVVDGINGMIIPPKNIQKLRESMMKMHTDETWRKELQKKSRQLIVERYEQQIVWDALLAEYKTLMALRNISFQNE